MILIVNKYLLAKGFKGISLWPFVVLRDKNAARDPVFINHERIHLKQQQELLVLPFYVIYIIEFGFKFIKYRNTFQAYRNISFEREAYENETDLHYCKTRKTWAFFNYFYSKE